ncbi:MULTISPECIES: Na+/H+ antiporter NhaC [Hafnia]|uniref:Na+/H+ antiporter NhaC n=1 Tax=Hafnia TaxID=568 RepID=UPI000DF40082|nr:Na+/H+ antiporter NhaC [Hafnia paralvei]MBU2674456.1 Na+/H+ antiporter NhaC [Hafnia paralvei]MDX6841245.1 Na+/H+ antiporter NhaC [Hafnia paralvei]RDA61256.1 Na+/H+ antiporter NhaC [Hafnia paralvei]RDA64085.1 Na+/H+ antiporter NhaC [Hafnia paralvei]RDA69889.1 Na+/H+ antiporter NhaC [Hafnia paralvei]
MELNSHTSKNRRKLSFFWSVLPMIVMLGGISIGYFIFNIRAEPMILMGSAVASFIAIGHGYTWDDILKSICAKISEALPVILIVASIGFLIGAWMVSGTIPMMIYYGLQLINPQYFYISAFLLGALISVCTGTSWGSIGTVGVAMIGVAIGLNVSLPIAAGAIVSGCWFGDKLSPVSDSTNMAALAAGVNLYSHIGHLLWTTGPGFILCCFIYSYMGMSIDTSINTPENIVNLMTSIGNIYHFNLFLLLPPVIVLYGSLSKRPPIPMLFLSTLISMILALVFQEFSASSVGESVVSGFKLSMIEGNTVSAISSDVSRLLERGGAISMFSSFVTVFSAFSFAGAMSVTGSLHTVIYALTKGVKSTFRLVLTTIITTFTICACTANGTLPLLLCGDAFKDEYKKRGLAAKNLSRTTEDAGTVVEPIIPWSASGVYCATMLGVATLDYLPWAILCYSGIIFALLWAATGIGIAKYNENDKSESVITHQL